MQCIFCEFCFNAESDVNNYGSSREIAKLKNHLFIEHKLIISDIYEIANLEEYFNYWRDLVQTKGSLYDYCAVTSGLFKDQAKKEKYMLLCPDLVPTDKELRDRLLNNASSKRKIVPLKDVVVAGPQKHFKKQTLSSTQSSNDDNDFDEIKTANPPVRNKDARKLLNGYGCSECLDYYGSLDLSPDQLKQRLNKCSRHRAQFSPPKTPPHYWDINIPSTPECLENGWLSTNS